MRLTALYGALFLASGAALLAITYGLLADQRVPAQFNVIRASNGTLKAVVAKPAAQKEVLRFAACMRAHGVGTKLTFTPNSGSLQIQAGPGTDAYRSALKACAPQFGANVGYLPLATLALSGPPAAFLQPARISGKAGQEVVQTGVAAILPTKGELNRLLVESGIALGVMAIVSIGLGWVMAGRALQPLRAMTSTARQISEENLHERLAVSGPADEMRDLGETINGLLGGLEKAFEGQRRFVANASHELRTPLAMMRTSLDVAMGKPSPSPDVHVLAGKLEEGLDQADRLLDGLLLLARAQRGALGEETDVPLEGLVGDALDARSSDISRLGLNVENTVVPAEVWGNETLLARLVFNLVDNAVRHNVAGGVVHISNDRENGMARLVVANSGQEIDEERLAELGEPFRRLGTERVADGNGAGLGLSIARAIAEAHGGVLRLHPRPEGGLVVVVRLPVEKRT
jgi:signal transduction histidine kinase